MKKIFHDIIPNEKRSIRNIPLRHREATDETQPEKEINDELVSSSISSSSRIHHGGVDVSVDGIRPKTKASNKLQSKIQSRMYEVNTTEEKTTEIKHAHKKNSGINAYELEDLEKKQQKELEEEQEEELDEKLDEESFEAWRSTKRDSYWRAWVLIAVLTFGGLFIFSTYFGRATILINPIKHDLVLKQSKIALSTIENKIENTEVVLSEDIKADGVLKVDRKATGTVILYNTFNSATQRLVAGTRLVTPNGLIYKTKNEASIPGQKTVSGKKVPGSVEVAVEASESGEQYNQAPKDFNVVAYKDSDKYTTIYGRSKGSLTGGYSGEVPNIQTADVTSATLKIKDELNTKIDAYFTDKANKIGDGFVYVPGGKVVDFGEVKKVVSKDGKKATISVKASASAVLFNPASFFAQVVKNENKNIEVTETSELTPSTIDSTSLNEGDATSSIVYTGDLSRLKISLDSSIDTSIKGAIKPKETNVLVSGTTTVSSSIDNLKIAKAVSGLSKEQAIGAIKKLVELESVEIDILPWWVGTLPSSSQIEIRMEE